MSVLDSDPEIGGEHTQQIPYSNIELTDDH